ncbi:MAG: carbohydrate-binding domain-containing protein [Lachnospiraceae bacterium]|nr:carbohydrate-binding domain-containing protein [Lachnospiraceae bacterium]MDE6252302.1 carbohydrate-binding domain-containing protein [Lachnospiraceae bacterium]
MRMNKSMRLITTTIIMAMMVSGCSLSGNNSKAESVKSSSDNSGKSITGSGSIYFDEDSVRVEGIGVSADGTTVTISNGGEYTFTGSLNSGQIVVDADSDVILVLNGMRIANEKEETLYIKNGDVTIKTVENTDNTITSGIEEVAEKISEDTNGAAIFAKDDLSITGLGKLNVNGYINNGIQSKDKLYIESGEINVVSSNDGIKGKEGVYAASGNISITSGGDGIQSDANMDISGGSINIISGGGAKDLDIWSQNKMPEDGVKPEMGEMPEGEGKPEIGEIPDDIKKLEQNESTNEGNSDDISTKGIKAEGMLSISDGLYTIDSLDDSIHSNKKIEISGGKFTINTGDDGVHADEELSIKSGQINIEKCNEGLESVNIKIDGGEFKIKSTDDGINANGGNDNFGGMFKKNSTKNENSNSSESDKSNSGASEETPVITINAGTIYIDAEGDGIDSNGSVYINGGDITVNGSSNGGNSAIDYGLENRGECAVSGGKIVATGYSNMAETFDSVASKQCSILYVFETDVPVGTEITIADESGKSMISYTTVKKCDSVIFSSQELELNKKYMVTAGEQSGTIDITENAVSNKAGNGKRVGR